MSGLAGKKCMPCEGGVKRLGQAEIRRMLKAVPGWAYEKGEIVRSFEFKNYYQTVSFVNAAAWIAHTQDHHPDIEFGYKTCKVRYSTHAVKGISENDFVCAAKLNRLLSE